MVGVRAGDVEVLRDVVLVNVGADAADEVVRDELVGALVLVDYSRLPREEVRERLGSVSRFYGNLVGVKYGEPFVVKESIRVDDIMNMPVRSI